MLLGLGKKALYAKWEGIIDKAILKDNLVVYVEIITLNILPSTW